ncbi:hypothetical protein ACLOJK_038801 [Asimina triloba]
MASSFSSYSHGPPDIAMELHALNRAKLVHSFRQYLKTLSRPLFGFILLQVVRITSSIVTLANAKLKLKLKSWTSRREVWSRRGTVPITKCCSGESSCISAFLHFGNLSFDLLELSGL